jgi:hypothetical protein
MGTYSRPGSAVSPYMIDRSAELLSKELGVAGDELIKQKENILISRNKLAEDNAKLKSGINSIEGGAGLEFKNNLTNMLSGLVDEANILGINSIGRDQTEYINEKSNIMTAVDQLPKLLAVLDEEAKMYGDVSDPSRQVLNSTDPLAREFMDNIRIYNGKDIRPEYKDGNIILKYTGKDGREFVLNGANYQRARENGTGELIKYSKDHSAEWKTIFDNLTNDTNYKELETKLLRESTTGKTTITTREKWEQANKELRQRLENSTTLLPTLDQSTFQLFYPGKEDELWTGSDTQIKDLKGKVIDEIMNNYAGTSKITSIVEREARDKGRGKDDKVVVSDYSDWISSNLYKKMDEPLDPGVPEADRPDIKMPFEEQVKIILEKIRSFNKTDLVYGNDKKVKNALGDEADSEKLYQLVKIPGAGSYNAFEITINEKDLKSDEALNDLLIDYENKYGSRKTKYQSRASR